jgi:hypothetical protein
VLLPGSSPPITEDRRPLPGPPHARTRGEGKQSLWFGACLLVVLPLVGGCELRGLTRSQLYGEAFDAAAVADTDGPPPDLRVDPTETSTPPDLAVVPKDGPAPPPGGIFVTGFVRGLCGNGQAMVGGAGFHTCSYAGKASYRLRIRDVPPGTRVEIGAKAVGYLPNPATTVMVLQLDGNTHDFDLSPASGSCDPLPPVVPCVCEPPSCDPS